MEENNTNIKQSKKSSDKNASNTDLRQDRAQLKHLLIDVDFFDKPSVRALIFKHGQISALLYVRWMMLMSRATNATVCQDALMSVASEVLQGVKSAAVKSRTILNFCVETKMLLQVSDDTFSSPRVIEDQESCAVKRSQFKERQAKFKNKKRECEVFDNALVTRESRKTVNTDTEQLNTEDLNTEDLRKETVTPPPTEILEPPPQSEFDCDEAKAALYRWHLYSTQVIRKPFDQLQADTLMMRYSGRLKDFIRDINGSISSNWRSVCDASRLEKSQFARAGPEPVNWELKREADREAAKKAHWAKVKAYLEEDTQ